MKNQSNNKIIFSILFWGLIIAAVVWFFDFQLGNLYNRPRVYFFDVGQGDSALIVNSHNQKILIDGGPDSTILSKLGSVLPFYDRYIDLVLLTHPHADHLTGLVDVLERYKVGAVILTGINFESTLYQLFLNKLGEKAVPKIIVDMPKLIKFGREEEIFKILYPLNNLSIKFFNKDFGSDSGLKSKDINDTSIISKFSAGDADFIFTGDAGLVVESRLMNFYKDELDAEVLKVGHHGSNYASLIGFLNFVSPEYSIISVGKNNYGHPDKKVISHLSKFSKIFRTDLDGDIEFSIENDRLKVATGN